MARRWDCYRGSAASPVQLNVSADSRGVAVVVAGLLVRRGICARSMTTGLTMGLATCSQAVWSARTCKVRSQAGELGSIISK
jgi:hypothetical protein